MSKGDKKSEGVLQRLVNNLNPVMGAIIGFFVLLLFCWAIYVTMRHLADPPVTASEGQDAYSAFDRAVQVVGLVSPVLTIVLGFYFGTRVGQGGVEAAQAAADRQLRSERDLSEERLRQVLEIVRSREPQVSTTIDQVASEMRVQPAAGQQSPGGNPS